MMAYQKLITNTMMIVITMIMMMMKMKMKMKARTIKKLKQM